MQMVLYAAAAVVTVVVLWDVFKTVFSTNGAGPLTRLWTVPLWRSLIFVHERRPIHKLLSLTGPFVLLATILIWYVLIGVAVYLALLPVPSSVINNTTGVAVDWLKKIYFVSTTISSLGYGDFVPSEAPWTLVATSSTLIATVVVTVSLSYVLSVLAAVIEGRKLAQGVFGLGDSASEIAATLNFDEPRDSLKEYVLGLSGEIDHHSLKHLAYPVLSYFHSPRLNSSSARAILLLSDTFFALDLRAEHRRPPIGVLRLMDSSIENYTDLTASAMTEGLRAEGGEEEVLDIMRSCEIDSNLVVDLEKIVQDYLQRRSVLLALCREDGWGVEQVAS